MSANNQDSYWQRRGRLTRRRFAGGLGVVGAGAAGLALVGCGGDDDGPAAGGDSTPGPSPSASGSPSAPRKGGELTYSLGVPTSQTLDPHKTVSLGFSYYGFFLDRIIAPDRHTITPLKGELVESWEQVDQGTFAFKVRQGVTWHEGKAAGARALDAEDIAFNINRIAGKTDPQRAGLYQRATNFFGLDKAEATDPATVRVTFSSPNSAFLSGLSDWRNWTIAREMVDKDPDFKDMKNFAGTGPFMIDGWDQSTMAGKYVANPKYWKEGQPYVDSIQQVSLSDTAATQAAFFSGKIDFLATIAQEVREQVESDRAGAKFYNYENLQWDYFGMNQSRAPFTDERVRQAIFKAIDYTSLLEQEYGKDFWSYTSVLLSGLPGAPTSAEAGKSSPFDPATKDQAIADAKKLLEQAGIQDGKVSFKVMPSSGTGSLNAHAVRMQDQLQKIWPNMKVELVIPADNGEFNRKLSQGDYDIVGYTAAPPPDAIFDPAQRLRTGGSRNYTKFSDPQVDSLVDAVFAEFDEAARKQKLDQLRLRMLDTIVNIPIGKLKQSIASQKRVNGFDGIPGPGSSLYPYEAINVSGQLWVS